MKEYRERNQYFDVTVNNEDTPTIKITDLNGNFTILDKAELKQLIEILVRCSTKMEDKK